MENLICGFIPQLKDRRSSGLLGFQNKFPNNFLEYFSQAGLTYKIGIRLAEGEPSSFS